MLIAVLSLLALAVVVVALLVLTSSQGGSTSATSTPAASNAPSAHHHRRPAPAAAPTVSHATVAVLNGTATSGLAHRVAVRLTGGGFKQGTVATATDQTHTATRIAYMPGHRRDAEAVALRLKLGGSSVAPLDQSTQAVACPPPGPCNSTVVVTVGSDLASIQG